MLVPALAQRDGVPLRFFLTQEFQVVVALALVMPVLLPRILVAFDRFLVDGFEIAGVGAFPCQIALTGGHAIVGLQLVGCF